MSHEVLEKFLAGEATRMDVVREIRKMGWKQTDPADVKPDLSETNYSPRNLMTAIQVAYNQGKISYEDLVAFSEATQPWEQTALEFD